MFGNILSRSYIHWGDIMSATTVNFQPNNLGNDHARLTESASSGFKAIFDTLYRQRLLAAIHYEIETMQLLEPARAHCAQSISEQERLAQRAYCSLQGGDCFLYQALSFSLGIFSLTLFFLLK